MIAHSHTLLFLKPIWILKFHRRFIVIYMSKLLFHPEADGDKEWMMCGIRNDGNTIYMMQNPPHVIGNMFVLVFLLGGS